MSLLNSYFEFKKFNNEKTQFEYEIIITKLLNSFGVNLEALGREELNQYLDGPFKYYTSVRNNEEIIKEYAPNTIEKNINILKSFFNTLYANNLINTNFADMIEATESNRVLKFDILPMVEEIKAIQEYLYSDGYAEDYFALRDLLIFNLIFHSGLSTKQLSALSINDLGMKDNKYVLKVPNSKYNENNSIEPKFKLMPINVHDVQLLTLLISLRSKLNPKDNAVFISMKHKKRMAVRSFSFVINEICKASSIDDVQINSYSAEKIKQVGIVAALSVNYPAHKMQVEMSVSENYFKQRFKHINYLKTVESYADLFKQ